MLNLNFGASIDFTWSGTLLVHQLFFEFEEVPDANSLVKTAAGDEGIFRVECSTHYIVRVPRQDCNFAAVLPVPDANCLVVARGDYPWQVMVELNCAYVVNVPVQSKHAFLGLVAPYFD